MSAAVRIARHRDSGSEEGVIRIDGPSPEHGVVSKTTEMADIARYGRSVGIRDVNADNLAWAKTMFEGWIEQVHATRPEPGH